MEGPVRLPAISWVKRVGFSDGNRQGMRRRADWHEACSFQPIKPNWRDCEAHALAGTDRDHSYWNDGPMKLRKESQGLHFYERKSGLHILLDEVRMPPDGVD